MAGSYPDYASYRMAYDRDGTQVFKIDTANTITSVSAANILAMNNENNDTYALSSANVGGTLVFIFPELRDIDGYTYIHWSGSTPPLVQVQTSTNTTNGLDGTWTNLGASFYATGGRSVVPYYRNDYTAAPVSAVKSIKFAWASITAREASISALHLFGKRTAGENPNRLILWNPTLNQRVDPSHFDWGDVRRASAATDKTFRVKNNSSTLTANGVTVSFDVLSDAAPSLLVGQHSLSTDGTTFGNTATIGALAPGAISGTVTMRRTISGSAALNVWAARVIASATSWT